MKTSKNRITNANGWILAVKLLKKYLIKPTKASALLSDLPENISSTDRRYCQFLFFGVIRHKLLIDCIIKKMLLKAPRVGLKALLMVAICEIIEMKDEKKDEKIPKIIDFAVENSKKHLSLGEAKLVNAVLRKVTETTRSIEEAEDISIDSLAVKYSHPMWLITRWIKEFGMDRTKRLLEWNQGIPPVYLRIEEEVDAIGLEATKWKGFYLMGNGGWSKAEELIGKGKAYIQDPSTRIAPEMAKVIDNENVLDLCAAPGGKSVMMASRLKGGIGQIVSIDLPGKRIVQLKENLAKMQGIKYSVIELDINDLSLEYFESLSLPGEYDVVLLDAPCSNTGVLRRRVDAKWRLGEKNIETMARIQLRLLKKAALFVKSGGRLIYSTCSIENEENFGVVEDFLENYGRLFECKQSIVSYPWDGGSDGGGAFLLIRKE